MTILSHRLSSATTNGPGIPIYDSDSQLLSPSSHEIVQHHPPPQPPPIQTESSNNREQFEDSDSITIEAEIDRLDCEAQDGSSQTEYESVMIDCQDGEFEKSRLSAVEYEESRQSAVEFEESCLSAVEYEVSHLSAVEFEESRQPAVEFEESCLSAVEFEESRLSAVEFESNLQDDSSEEALELGSINLRFQPESIDCNKTEMSDILPDLASDFDENDEVLQFSLQDDVSGPRSGSNAARSIAKRLKRVTSAVSTRFGRSRGGGGGGNERDAGELGHSVMSSIYSERKQSGHFQESNDDYVDPNFMKEDAIIPDEQCELDRESKTGGPLSRAKMRRMCRRRM